METKPTHILHVKVNLLVSGSSTQPVDDVFCGSGGGLSSVRIMQMISLKYVKDTDL